MRPSNGGAHDRGFRPDIQGLRAVAVLTVVLNHAGVRGFRGGFIGVDVFFVISGFLITGWLLKRVERTGSVPFSEFYAARARRILPAATLVLAATAAGSFYYLNYVRAESALRDSIWASVFAANIHFAEAGRDYFARDTPPSPVQQYWTLAVEEQFYVVWPAIIGLVLVATRGAGGGDSSYRFRRRVLIGVVAIGVLASLLWSIRSTSQAPATAYFSTLTRAWELGLGALLALSVSNLAKLPGALKSGMGWLGLGGIALASVTFSSSTAFPGYAALLPVAGAALVIASGVGGVRPSGVGAVLGRQPLRFCGDVSYSFYLWHWPILIIAAEHEGRTLPVTTNVLLLAGAFGLAAATYRWFENPIRHGTFFDQPRPALMIWPFSVSMVVIIASVGINAISTRPVPLIASRSELALGPTRNPTTNRVRKKRPSFPTLVTESVTPSVAKMAIHPSALYPAPQNLSDDVVNLDGCVAAYPNGTRGPICHWGDNSGSHLLVAFGDSHMQMWMPGVLAFARENHWRVVPIIKDSCTPLSWEGVGETPACKTWFAWALEQAARLHPSAVVFGTDYSISGINEHTASSTDSGVSSEIEALKKVSSRVAVIEDAPTLPKLPLDCLLARGSTRGSCTFPLTSDQAHLNSMIREITVSDGAMFLPTVQWFCASGRCPVVVGSMITYLDYTHVTSTYTTALAASLAARIRKALDRPMAVG